MDFENIYRRYFNDVFKYLLRLSNDEHIAEEITADTFFRALRKIDSFRGDCDLRVWLCQIAKNSYLSYIRKRGHTEELEYEKLANIIDPSKSTEEKCIISDTAEEIQNILHDIPEPYKEVFMWRVFAELSFKEIAQIFKKSENWACVTYHRARAKIIERLEETTNEK